ncbi:hypothetical protein [Paenibacillus xanthanilyticus]|uniref:Magnesium transporter n=1 Tax=Paenibacillus xanthanilyticus TaxID=1783531 RepID=A0ABV8JY22_9BACL
MYIIATFEQSIFLELALSALTHKGLTNEQILAVPLDKRTEPRKLFDTIHSADGFSTMDAAAILGTCLMLLGAVYGYELAWGPIWWGLIGLLTGIAIGFGLKMLLLRKTKNGAKAITSEVVLVIRCEDRDRESIEELLWNNTALGVSAIRHLS